MLDDENRMHVPVHVHDIITMITCMYSVDRLAILARTPPPPTNDVRFRDDKNFCDDPLFWPYVILSLMVHEFNAKWPVENPYKIQ